MVEILVFRIQETIFWTKIWATNFCLSPKLQQSLWRPKIVSKIWLTPKSSQNFVAKIVDAKIVPKNVFAQKFRPKNVFAQKFRPKIRSRTKISSKKSSSHKNFVQKFVQNKIKKFFHKKIKNSSNNSKFSSKNKVFCDRPLFVL